jgi:hypothetical protein
MLEPRFERIERSTTHGQHAGLVALAGHANAAIRYVQIEEIETNELAKPQAGRVKQLEHRAIAHGQLAIAFDCEQTCDLIGIERCRKPTSRLRRLHVDGRVRRDDVGVNEKAQELPHGRQTPRKASRARTLAVAPRRVTTNQVSVESLELE